MSIADRKMPAVSPQAQFENECRELAEQAAGDPDVQQLSQQFIDRTAPYKYAYQFRWMGRPIIQFPQDMIAMQQIIWSVQPDVIVETGIAHGGSLIYYASLLELMGGKGKVIGVDVEIRPHNREAIEQHNMFSRIEMIEGSSTHPDVVQQVRQRISEGSRVLVTLDSNHTHDHVLDELRLYSPLVSRDSYLVVFDTVVERMPDGMFPNRPWGRGNNPMTAVRQFLSESDRFVVDESIEQKLLISVAPEGYLRCVKD